MIRNPYFETCEAGENDMIEFALCYEMRMPVSLFGVERIPMRSVVSRRAWTGAEGGRGAALYGGQSGTDEEGYSRDEDGDRTVYIGKTSTVYHKDRSCHYLDNVLKKVSAEDVDALRSRSGGRYHACEGCRPEKQGEVYILESGTAYHRSADCGSISAYAREIKLKDAAHLGPCSYCTKKS